jgi:hypothetical protein
MKTMILLMMLTIMLTLIRTRMRMRMMITMIRYIFIHNNDDNTHGSTGGVHLTSMISNVIVVVRTITLLPLQTLLV